MWAPEAGRVTAGPDVAVERVRLAVRVTDPLAAAGLREYFDECAEFTVTTEPDEDDARVRILAIEHPMRGTLTLLRGFARVDVPTVLIGNLPETDLPAALDYGVMAVLPARVATPERLAGTVRAVLAGDVVLPPGLVAGLVRHLRRVQHEVLDPNGLSSSGLTTREVDVLRLLADGFDTAEIATKLNYAERTVKNVVSTLTDRLNLRNRTHAVSYALRNNLI
jgi:DNA-binding NarL/FixJ family response regulator